MALGTTMTAIVAGLAAGGIGAAAASMMDKKKPQTNLESSGTGTGKVDTVESVDAQAAQRRLARLSKYFTSPSGVLDGSTGSAGVF